MIKDSGNRRVFETGGQRDIQEGKGRMDLLPMRALIELSKHFEEGAKKYEDRNWEKGIPIHSFLDSGLRHIAQFMSGKNDEPHLKAACWNLICCLDTIIRIEEGLLPQDLFDIPIDYRIKTGPIPEFEVRTIETGDDLIPCLKIITFKDGRELYCPDWPNCPKIKSPYEFTKS